MFWIVLWWFFRIILLQARTVRGCSVTTRVAQWAPQTTRLGIPVVVHIISITGGKWFFCRNVVRNHVMSCGCCCSLLALMQSKREEHESSTRRFLLHRNLANLQRCTEIPTNSGQNPRNFMKFSQQWALTRACVANHFFDNFHIGFGFFCQIHREFFNTIPCAWHKVHNHEQTFVSKTQTRLKPMNKPQPKPMATKKNCMFSLPLVAFGTAAVLTLKSL